jgi:hypothetical protein
MRTTQLAAGAGKLQHDLKNLRAHWDRTGDEWDDAVRREFEEKRLEPVERAVEAAVRALDELQGVFRKMGREVGPRE